MKIRMDFVTNSSSSSFICKVVITDKDDKTYDYSLSDNYDEEMMDNLPECYDFFVSGLEQLAKKTTGSSLLGAESVAELAELLADNIKEQNDRYADQNKLIKARSPRKKKYIDLVTDNVKSLDDIKKIEFRTDIYAYGEGTESVPSELITPDDYDGDFEGFESTILDVKTNKTSYTNSRIRWEEDNPEKAARFKEEEAKREVKLEKERAERLAQEEKRLAKQRAKQQAKQAERWMKRYGKYIEQNPTIALGGKKFVFTGLSEELPLIVERLQQKGGLYRESVSGVTDYLVVNPAGAGDTKIKKVMELQKAGKPVKAVLFDDFEKAIE